MPRVVPSQVVELIDKLFPQAKGERENHPLSLGSDQAERLSAILELTQEIPPDLITLHSVHYAEYIASISAIRYHIRKWQVQPKSFPQIPTVILGLRPHSPVALIRQALAKCPDEFPSSGTQEFKFITDGPMREAIRLDMSATNSALTNGEWKASTVLAGSLIEALLLWKIEQQNPALRSRALAALGRQLDSNPQRWVLADYIDVAERLNMIKPNTVILCRVAKDFRNLIHPGRALRLNQLCNRGTAMAAVSALEHVIQDIEGSSPMT